MCNCNIFTNKSLLPSILISLFTRSELFVILYELQLNKMSLILFVM